MTDTSYPCPSCELDLGIDQANDEGINECPNCGELSNALKPTYDRLRFALGRALERVQVGDCGACSEAELILEQFIELNGDIARDITPTVHIAVWDEDTGHSNAQAYWSQAGALRDFNGVASFIESTIQP